MSLGFGEGVSSEHPEPDQQAHQNQATDRWHYQPRIGNWCFISTRGNSLFHESSSIKFVSVCCLEVCRFNDSQL